MNSFDARSTLTVGDRDVRDLPARRAAVEVRRRAAAVRAQGPAREPAAQRGRADRRRATTSRRSRRWVRDGRAEPRDRLHAGARAAAGLHRRAGGRRPGGDARRDARAGRRPGAHQPAAAGRARDRPLRAGRRVRHAEGVPVQRRPRVRAQQGALRVPALGPAGVRQLRRRAARHRHRAPGQPRVPRARRVRPRGRRRRRRRTRTRSSAPTRTPRWSTASACSAGAWGGSRPRPRCSASRSRC